MELSLETTSNLVSSHEAFTTVEDDFVDMELTQFLKSVTSDYNINIFRELVVEMIGEDCKPTREFKEVMRNMIKCFPENIRAKLNARRSARYVADNYDTLHGSRFEILLEGKQKPVVLQSNEEIKTLWNNKRRERRIKQERIIAAGASLKHIGLHGDLVSEHILKHIHT